MADRVVVLRIGEHLFSLPFVHVDEILSGERAVRRSELPEGTSPDPPSTDLWINSRGRWLGVQEILPGGRHGEKSQIVVLDDQGSARAIVVDQVVGIEKAGGLATLPEVVMPYLDLPFAGVRFLKDRPLLELDLSRLFSLDRGIERVG